MYENLYTTKMSTDKKKLQNRFLKICSRNGRISKMIAFSAFVVVLVSMALITVIFAASFNNDNEPVTAAIDSEKLQTDTTPSFVWPCNGELSVSNRFGTRTHPITGEVKEHNGVDIKAPEGTDVMSATDGTVKAADYDNEKGYYVIVEKDNMQTVYASLTEEIKVKKGESVKAGQVIGKVGMTGSSTGAHLHFEVLINGEYHDPELIK